MVQLIAAAQGRALRSSMCVTLKIRRPKQLRNWRNERVSSHTGQTPNESYYSHYATQVQHTQPHMHTRQRPLRTPLHQSMPSASPLSA
jgi:hypothetical protein